MAKKVTNIEIAARIEAHLKRFEADPAVNRNTARTIFGDDTYYRVNAWATGNRIAVDTANRLDTEYLTRADAEGYLAWLDAGNVGQPIAYAMATAKKV